MSEDGDSLKVLAPPSFKRRLDAIEAAVQNVADRPISRRDALGVAGLALLAAGGVAGSARAAGGLESQLVI